MDSTEFPSNASLDIITSFLISHYLMITASWSHPHGIKPWDSGISEPVRPPRDSLDTPRKSSHALSPLITDKLSHQEPTRPSSSGTLSVIASSPPKPTTTLIGFHQLNIHPSLNHKARLHSNLTSPQSDGMEDWKFGTLTSKLDILSSLMMETLTQLPSPPMENIWPPEERINALASGISLILRNPSEPLKLVQPSLRSHSTLNYNGSALPLKMALKFGT